MSRIVILIIMLVGFITTGLPNAHGALFNFSGGLDIYGTYDDNILLLSDDEKEASNVDPEDYIIQIHPYVTILSEGTRSSFKLYYQYYHEWYRKDHNLDRTNTSFHDGYIDASWEATDHLSISLFDQYRDSLYGLERDEVPEIRDDYRSNHLSPRIKYAIDDRFMLTGSVNWSFQDYEEAPIVAENGDIGYSDWDEMGWGLNGEVTLTTRTDFIFGGDVWSREYDYDMIADYSDSQGYNVNVGVSQVLGHDFTLRGYGQFSHREYDDELYESGDTSYDGFGGSLEIQNRTVGYSGFVVRAFSRFEGSERISGAYYRSTGIESEYFTVFGKHLETAFKVHYSTYEYDNVEDGWSDDLFRGAVTLGYRFNQWMSVRGQYQYTVRNSDRPYDDFDNHLLSLYLHLSKDFNH